MLVTLVTGIFLIPIAALFVGGPVYLITGTPVLLWMVGRYPPKFNTYALGGLLTNVALLAVYELLARVSPEISDWELTAYFVSGLVFAPIWAGTFGILYANFTQTDATP